METAPLKSFATSARTALIREVSARIAVVLSSASTEWIERPTAVSALERAINAAGDGDTGRAAVADKVAYTWFNRIVALRFMDANGYTGIGVVSPEHGHISGQPEVLAEAKRGNIDTRVVDATTAATITGLLNGTSRSDDPQGEAYGLLLADYCRYWNRSMPFMFEREGDYTELLIPSDLLADESVMARAVNVLTPDVCNDVEVIGWLYQFYISERKDEVFAGFRKNQKAGAAEIPAATQLFTPDWIVRYLVDNSLGRLWLLNRPKSRLTERMEYYIPPVNQETNHLEVSSPEDLRVMDPACGSGHMLTYAFDLLYTIYEEEGYAPVDIPALILKNNLYGAEIDARAGSLAAFGLMMKARAKQRAVFDMQVVPNIRVLESVRFERGDMDKLCTPGKNREDEKAFWNQFEDATIFGSLIRPDESLIEPLRRHLSLSPPSDLLEEELHERANGVLVQAEYLSQRYHVVVANPPYMGSGNMNSKLAAFAKSNFSTSKFDLFSMFIRRCSQLVVGDGLIGIITMQSWMFLSSFRRFRQELLAEGSVVTMAHLGPGAFDTITGDVVATTAFVIEARPLPAMPGVYFRLTRESSELTKSRKLRSLTRTSSDLDRFHVATQQLETIPGSPIAYWISKATIVPFTAPAGLLEKFAESDGKNVTSDNARFIRFHWEVSRRDVGAFEKHWLPCALGGPYRKWSGNIIHVIDWSEPARTFYRSNSSSRIVDARYWARTGVTWTKIGSGRPSFRILDSDEMYQEVAILQRDPEDTFFILALLNSSAAEHYLEFLSPTVNFQREDIVGIPLGESERFKQELASLSHAAVEIARHDWNSQEVAVDFENNGVIATRGDGSRLHELFERYLDSGREAARSLLRMEESINLRSAEALGIGEELSPAGGLSQVSLLENSEYRFRNAPGIQRRLLHLQVAIEDVVSFAVGCMFGRYSLDTPGLVLANQGDTLLEYLSRVPEPSFMPDADNVIPIVDADWFEDDIVARFRRFLRVAFGEEHFEENLRFVTESLGVKDLRDYFVKSFYKDHVQRYKKRPIYWLFSSPKGSFNALIYMHRYTPSTVSTVLNEYLREFKAKLEASLQHEERLALDPEASPQERAVAQKKADSIRKTLLELDGYEHDVLYPLATQQIEIDLDDGVKVNYPKFGEALKKIAGLEATDD